MKRMKNRENVSWFYSKHLRKVMTTIINYIDKKNLFAISKHAINL